MRTSENISAIADALSKAQKDFPIIEKDREVEQRGVSQKTGKEYSIIYKFASYEAIVDAVRKPLCINGLSYVHDIDLTKKVCITRLLHSSGEWIENEFPVVMNVAKMQEYGKDSTYAKRYGLSNLLGIASDEDTDASEEQAEIKQTKKEPKKEIKNHAPKSLVDQIADEAKKKGMSNANITEAIKLSTGKMKASECSDEELMTVLAYLRMK